MKGKLPFWRGKDQDKSRVNAAGGHVSSEDMSNSSNNRKSTHSIQSTTTSCSSSNRKKPAPSITTRLGLKSHQHSTSTASTLSSNLSFSQPQPHLVDASNPPSSPLNDGYSTFSFFQQQQSTSPIINRRTSFNVDSSTYPPSPRPRTADAATFQSSRARSKTDLASQPMTSSPWVNKPLPLHPENDFQSKTLPIADSTGDMNGRFFNPALIRPRTSSAVEGQRRARTDIVPGTRLVPPIATNFDSHYITNSPISKTSSRSTTPRGTPTSAKVPGIRNSILDEVEGNLAATIRDFQSLQGTWHHDSPPQTPEQVYGPQQPYLSNDHVQRRGSSTPMQPGDTSYFSLPNWDQSHMAAAVAQHQVFLNGNGSHSLPHTPSRNVSASAGALIGDYADFDAKYLALQQSFEEQKKAIHIMQIESGGAKKQIDFLRARLAEYENEKSNLQQTLRDAEEKMQITLTKLREAKVGELAAHREIAAAKNTISILETRCESDQKKVKALTEELEGERETVDKVQAKLEEANTHKVDLQEREFENRKEIIVTKKKLKKATDELNLWKRKDRNTIAQHTIEAEKQRQLLEQTQAELEEVKKQNTLLAETQSKLEESQKHNSILEEQLQKLSPDSDLPSRVAEMGLQIDALESELSVRNTLITELQQSKHTSMSSTETSSLPPIVNVTAPSPISPTSPTEVDDMRRMMEVMDKTRRDVVAERDRLAALLHAELRRSAVEEHDRKHPSLPFLKGKNEIENTRVLVRGKALDYVKDHAAKSNGLMLKGISPDNEEGLEKKVTNLEKEIEYYLNDIILYKLDVKGYKKDLRKAEKRIRDLNGLGGATTRSVSSDSRLQVSKIVSPLAAAVAADNKQRGRSIDGLRVR